MATQTSDATKPRKSLILNAFVEMCMWQLIQ